MDDDAGTVPEAQADPHGSGSDEGRRFRLAFVPGATPAKWVRTWRERHPDVPLDLVAVEAEDAERALLDHRAEAALLRPPVDRDVLGAIGVYEESVVVVVSRDHLLAALEPDETVAPADLADDVVLRPLDDVVPWAGEPGAPEDAAGIPGQPAVERPATTRDAVVLVAAGVGVVVVPQSLARLHQRKDVTYRHLDGAPPVPVALAWVTEREDELVEEMIGIVRGRTVNSSRGRAAGPGAAERAPSPDRAGKRGGASRSGAAGGTGRSGKGSAGRSGKGAGGRSGRDGGRKGRGSGGRGGR